MMEWKGDSIGTVFIDSRSGEFGSRPGYYLAETRP